MPNDPFELTTRPPPRLQLQPSFELQISRGSKQKYHSIIPILPPKLAIPSFQEPFSPQGFPQAEEQQQVSPQEL